MTKVSLGRNEYAYLVVKLGTNQTCVKGLMHVHHVLDCYNRWTVVDARYDYVEAMKIDDPSFSKWIDPFTLEEWIDMGFRPYESVTDILRITAKLVNATKLRHIVVVDDGFVLRSMLANAIPFTRFLLEKNKCDGANEVVNKHVLDAAHMDMVRFLCDEVPMPYREG
jgi:hypothetical protein